MKKPFLIETPRLILRDFVPGDWKAVHEYASDPQVVRYVPWGPNTVPQTKSFIRMARKWDREKPRKQYDLAIVLRSENRLIGAIGIQIQSAIHRKAYLGYCLNRKYWGKGYATEAAKSLVEFGFSRLRLHRICATCNARNKASARVLIKVGMRREGHFHKDVFEKGSWRDTYHFAVLEKKGRRRG